MSVQVMETFLQSKLAELLNTDHSFAIDEDLRQYGLDSLSMVNLMISLEDEFAILFEDDDLLIGNFATIQKISELVKNKRAF